MLTKRIVVIYTVYIHIKSFIVVDLNLYNGMCQLHLNKTGRKKDYHTSETWLGKTRPCSLNLATRKFQQMPFQYYG